MRCRGGNGREGSRLSLIALSFPSITSELPEWETCPPKAGFKKSFSANALLCLLQRAPRWREAQKWPGFFASRCLSYQYDYVQGTAGREVGGRNTLSRGLLKVLVVKPQPSSWQLHDSPGE